MKNFSETQVKELEVLASNYQQDCIEKSFGLENFAVKYDGRHYIFEASQLESLIEDISSKLGEDEPADEIRFLDVALTKAKSTWRSKYF